MGSSNCSQPWSELLCCVKCKDVFSQENLPVNLVCSHLMCKDCVANCAGVICPLDKSVENMSKFHYINGPVLSIVLGKRDLNSSNCMVNGTMKSLTGQKMFEASGKIFEKIEAQLYRFAGYLYRVQSDRGATICSTQISRTIQRKLLLLLCTNILTPEGRVQMAHLLRSMVERIVSELILHIQTNSNLSSSLWSAVRARGCQFLGPAFQEDVLKIIHHVMQNGDELARKTLVLFIVQKLEQDYPHISKTSVGHVVQLLYRASCFNVIKQEGQSSLMQMKEDFRNYDALRTEHDAQIVQIAMEAGLRISPDQWSSLLYGDSRHRVHMQSICDRLSDNSLQKAVDELHKLVDQQPPEWDLFGISDIFGHYNALIASGIESAKLAPDWTKLESMLDHTNSILAIYSKFIQKRNKERENHRHYSLAGFPIGREQNSAAAMARTPFSGALSHHPLANGFGCGNSTSIPALLPYPSAQFQPPSLASYLLESSMGSSPPNNTNFIAPPPPLPPLSMSPPTIYNMGRRDSGIGRSQHDSLETVPTTLMTVLPISPVTQRYMDQQMVTTTMPMPNPSTSPTMYSNGPPSIIFLGNNGPPECTMLSNSATFIGPPSQPPISASPPPTYQFGPGGLISAPAYSIPVQQSQSLIVYGSTPPGTTFAFGSPPLLFPQWVTPLDAATIPSGFGQNLLGNATTTIGSPYCAQLSGISFESDEENNHSHRHSPGNNNNYQRGKQRHQSFRTATTTAKAEEEDSGSHECHVSFTVATSVLNEEKFGNSAGSTWTLELPAGSMSVSIPLSPAQTLKYTMARDHPIMSSKGGGGTNLCTVIQTAMNASTMSSLIDAATAAGAPSLAIHHDLNPAANSAVDLSISS